MRPCPECGNPPQYTSFCTKCAQLFRRPRRHWERKLAAKWDGEIRSALETQIRQLHWLGRTTAEAAAELGMTPEKLNKYRRTIGLEPFAPPNNGNTRRDAWRDDEIEALAEAIRSGDTVTGIAARLGRSAASVQVKRCHLGLPRFRKPRKSRKPPPVWDAGRIAELARLRAKGLSFKRCGMRLHKSRNSIAYAVHHYLVVESAQP